MSDGMDRGDLFDDFEFKPLTDGLGFHKKAEKIKSDIKASQIAFDTTARTVPEPPPRATITNKISEPEPLSAPLGSSLGASPAAPARPASQSISDLIASLPPSLDYVETPAAKEPAGYTRPQIFQPIAREEFKTDFKSDFKTPSAATIPPMPGPTIGSVLPAPGTKAGGVMTAAAIPAPTVGATLPASPYRDRMNESFAKAFPHAGATKRETVSTDAEQTLQPVVHNMAGAILDAMVALGISTIFLVCILAITRVNLMGLLTNANTDVATQIHLGLLFLAVLQMYMLTARSFFGASLGEWAFDIQVGTEEQQRRAVYPLQVAWRTLLVTITGFFPLPLISLAMKRDVTKQLTGVELLRRP